MRIRTASSIRVQGKRVEVEECRPEFEMAMNVIQTSRTPSRAFILTSLETGEQAVLITGRPRKP